MGDEGVLETIHAGREVDRSVEAGLVDIAHGFVLGDVQSVGVALRVHTNAHTAALVSLWKRSLSGVLENGMCA